MKCTLGTSMRFSSKEVYHLFEGGPAISRQGGAGPPEGVERVGGGVGQAQQLSDLVGHLEEHVPPHDQYQINNQPY